MDIELNVYTATHSNDVFATFEAASIWAKEYLKSLYGNDIEITRQYVSPSINLYRPVGEDYSSCDGVTITRKKLIGFELQGVLA